MHSSTYRRLNCILDARSRYVMRTNLSSCKVSVGSKHNNNNSSYLNVISLHILDK